MRALEAALSGAANVGWTVCQAVNRWMPAKPFQPGWAPRPMLKSWEKSSPVLGWPRTTDSLCPTCVREARAPHPQRRRRRRDRSAASRVGEIKAHIVERDGKVIIEKTVPDPRHVHRHARDQSGVPRRASSRCFPAATFTSVTDHLHNHGTSSIKYGRGAVLTIDLTNRCNMMCDPCFMDANQVGYVHELTLDDVKQLLDDAITIKPRRQMTVQFSGGEPTLSPIFLDAVALRARGRLLQRPGGDQRHPLRAGAGLRARRRSDGRPAHRLPAVRRRRRRRQRAPQGRQPVRREAARDREPARRRHRRLPRRRRSSTRSTTTRSGRSSSSRSRTATRSASSRSSRCRSPAATRTSTTRTRHAQRYTLSHLAEDLKQQTGVDRAAARLVSALGRRARSRTSPTCCRARRRLGLAQVRLPSELRHRHGASW